MNEKLYGRQWFFNVTFDNQREELFKKMQRRIIRDVFLHSLISITMFIGSYSGLLCKTPFSLRAMVCVGGINFAFAFHQLVNWKLNRLQEKLEAKEKAKAAIRSRLNAIL